MIYLRMILDLLSNEGGEKANEEMQYKNLFKRKVLYMRFFSCFGNQRKACRKTDMLKCLAKDQDCTLCIYG